MHEDKQTLSVSMSTRKAEDSSTQYNLEIALSTIQELQCQLVHCNRTIEQLAAENVALTRDLKKARRQVGRVEAKVIKARQVASDITPGARKILQETIEENTRTLSDFLETLNNKGALPDRFASPQKRGATPASALPPSSSSVEQQEAQAAAVAELKGVVERLLELKRHQERALDEKRSSSSSAPAAVPVCAVCQENRRRETEAKRQQKDEEVAGLRARISTLEGELARAKRELKAVQQREGEEGGVQQQRSMDRVAVLGAQYAKLQKHALYLTMQNDQLRDQARQLKAQQQRLQGSVQVAKDMLKRSADGPLEHTVSEQAAEIERLKGVVADKEAMLRTQMRIKSVVAGELSVKRREVKALKHTIATTLQARLATRAVGLEPRPYQVKQQQHNPRSGSVYGSFGRPVPTSPRLAGSPRASTSPRGQLEEGGPRSE